MYTFKPFAKSKKFVFCQYLDSPLDSYCRKNCKIKLHNSKKHFKPSNHHPDRDLVTHLVPDRDLVTHPVLDRDLVTHPVPDRYLVAHPVPDRYLVTHLVPDRE
jgi:hypothetical protein